MTITTRHAELEPNFHEYFDIRYGSVSTHLRSELDLGPGEALAFEFDYPDRPGLFMLRSTKQRYPHVPILMLTAQHSEQLAVWAYRIRVIDYMVTPVTQADLIRCSQLLQAVQQADHRQRERTIIDYQSSIPVEIPVGQRVRRVRLEAALDFVRANFRRIIRVAEVAEACGMSSFHFSHEFTEAFSFTFQEFLLRYRILEACKELRHPNIAVANVAYSVGFNDPSYFARVFRRYFDLSPSEYSAQIGHGDYGERLQRMVERLELPVLGSKNRHDRPGDRRQTDLQRRHIGGAAKH
jgi:AraC-like DNA-binding protein